MFKKLYIGFCFFLFAQQEYFAMETTGGTMGPLVNNMNHNDNVYPPINSQYNMNPLNNSQYNMNPTQFQAGDEAQNPVPSIGKRVNEWVNGNNNNNNPPALWWLWAFTDNVHFQYGNSKELEHGEAYYGLINGIGLFPSFLNFGWIKIGIIDLHFDMINAVIHFIRNCIRYAAGVPLAGEEMILTFFGYDILGSGTHLLSFKIFNGIKIRLISIFWCIFAWFIEKKDKILDKDNMKYSWYYREYDGNVVCWLYMVLSPRIEINIITLRKFFCGLRTK